PQQAVRKLNADKAHREGDKDWSENLRFRAIAQNGVSRDSRAGIAEPATAGALNEQQVLLSTLPPSRGQQRLALATILVLLAAFCATVPFATVPVGYIREFIPAYAAAM